MLRISTLLECLIFIPCREDCIDGCRSLRFCISTFQGILLRIPTLHIVCNSLVYEIKKKKTISSFFHMFV